MISWPLLDIGRVKTGVDQARAEANEAAAQHQQTVLRALEEVETSLAAYAKARERLQHLAAGRTEATTWLVAVYRAVGGMMLPGR